MNLEIQRSQYIRPKVTVHKCAEIIQGRKLFKGGNYMRKYGIPVSITLLILLALKTNRHSTGFQQVVDEKQDTAAKKFLGFNFIFFA